MSTIIGISKDGKEVALDAPGVAYQMDKSDKDFDKDLDLLRAKLKKEDGFSVISDESKSGLSGTFHQSVNGIAVPLTVADTQTPEQKLDEIRKAGHIQTDALTGVVVVSEAKLPAKKPA